MRTLITAIIFVSSGTLRAQPDTVKNLLAAILFSKKIHLEVFFNYAGIGAG